jgi:hypothetical protein
VGIHLVESVLLFNLALHLFNLLLLALALLLVVIGLIAVNAVDGIGHKYALSVCGSGCQKDDCKK